MYLTITPPASGVLVPQRTPFTMTAGEGAGDGVFAGSNFWWVVAGITAVAGIWSYYTARAALRRARHRRRVAALSRARAKSEALREEIGRLEAQIEG